MSKNHQNIYIGQKFLLHNQVPQFLTDTIQILHISERPS